MPVLNTDRAMPVRVILMTVKVLPLDMSGKETAEKIGTPRFETI